MMKKETIQRLVTRTLALTGLLVCLHVHALAYDANMAGSWMGQFAQALSALSPVNDPVLTADPARAGQYLLEYEFGTVLSLVSANPSAEDILEIDVRTSQVTDCRGVRVGMELEQALAGVWRFAAVCAFHAGGGIWLELGLCGRRGRVRRGIHRLR